MALDSFPPHKHMGQLRDLVAVAARFIRYKEACGQAKLLLNPVINMAEFNLSTTGYLLRLHRKLFIASIDFRYNFLENFWTKHRIGLEPSISAPCI